MQNVLIVSAERGFDKGGMALSCERFAKMLAAMGDFRVKFLMSCDYPIATAKGNRNPIFEEVIMKEYKLKTDAITYYDTDIVIAFGGRFNGYYASLLSERIGCRFIISLRGSDTYTVKWSEKQSWYFTEVARRAEKILCLSQEMARNVLSLSPESSHKIYIIPNPVSLDVNNRVKFPNLPESVKVGCAASEMNEKKGVMNLLYMLAEFKRLYETDITLQIVGKIEDYLAKQYEKTATSLSIWDNVIFSGYVSRNKLLDIMRGWDFYVQGSVCEGQSNSVVECIQAGRGFIMSNTGFLSEILRDDFPELVFSSWKPEIMANELRRLIFFDGKEDLYKRAAARIMKECSEDLVKAKVRRMLSQ